MAGYSETILVKKLGIKPDFQIILLGEPKEYMDWIFPVPEGVKIKKIPTKGTIDFIHLFVTENKIFTKEVIRLKKCLKPNGMIWVSWPKKSSKVLTDMDENVIRDFALKNGLVDVKVCAVSEIWSGLKLVIPVKLR